MCVIIVVPRSKLRTTTELDTRDVHSAVLLLVQTDTNPIIIVGGDNNDNDDISDDNYMLTSPHTVQNMLGKEGSFVLPS